MVNISLRLDSNKTWERFKIACNRNNSNPDNVLKVLIERYINEVKKDALEYELAQGMIEAKNIAQGKMKTKRAIDLLDEI